MRLLSQTFLADYDRLDYSPCLILRYNDANNIIKNDSKNRSRDVTKGDNGCPLDLYLSYNSAHIVLVEHQRWISEKIANLQSNVDDAASYDIAIAYLGSNDDPDYYISVLACSTFVSLRRNPSTEGAGKNIAFRSVPPILLNTRWTSREIASVLEPHRHEPDNGKMIEKNNSVDHDSKAKRIFHTILLYSNTSTTCDDSYRNTTKIRKSEENLARQVKEAIESKNNGYLNHTHVQQRHHHIVQCIPIPNFTRSRLTTEWNPLVEQSTATPRTPLKLCVQHDVNEDNEEDTTSAKGPLLEANEYSRKLGKHNTTTESDENALIVFTSGTSGIGKGVLLSHRSVLVQSNAKVQLPCQYTNETIMVGTTVPFFHVAGISSTLAVWLARGTIILPQHDKRPKSSSFDPHQLLCSLQPSSFSIKPTPFFCNTLVVVPAMLHFIQETLSELEKQKRSRFDTYPGVKLILIGGQSASKHMIEHFIPKYFPNARVVQTYACTEAASSLTFIQLVGPSSTSTRSMFNDSNKSASNFHMPSGDCVGKPPKHIEMFLTNVPENSNVWNRSSVANNIAELNEELPPLQIVTEPFQLGVIATRGEHVMNGYWFRGCQQPMQQRRKRWFVTSDLGFFDQDGNLYFHGRSTDTIRTGGETVQANEVEHVIGMHPIVKECAVFGLKDTVFGEIVCCAVVLKEDPRQQQLVSSQPTSGKPIISNCFNSNNDKTSLPKMGSEERIQPNFRYPNDDENNIFNVALTEEFKIWCIQKDLAGYKRPRKVFILNEMPRNSSGKILKFRLVERFSVFVSKIRSSSKL